MIMIMIAMIIITIAKIIITIAVIINIAVIIIAATGTRASVACSGPRRLRAGTARKRAW